MPSDGTLVVRAFGYWAGWLYIARKFGWPPPDSKKASKGGLAKGKQPDKGAKVASPTESKDQPKEAAPNKPKPDGKKKSESKAGLDVSKKTTTKASSTKEDTTSTSALSESALIWNWFGVFGTAKPSTSKDLPNETGLNKSSKATAGNAAPSK